MSVELKFPWHYAGDGVYVKHDGYGLWLHANSHDAPTDKVYLEPDVLSSVLEYKERCESDALIWKVRQHQKEKHEPDT
jgi:hypothetical protein